MVLGVRIHVGQQDVEDSRPQQGEHVASGHVAPRQGKEVLQRGPSDARLVSLVLAPGGLPSAWQKSSWCSRTIRPPPGSVVPRDQQIRPGSGHPGGHLRGGEPGAARQDHAERLVLHAAVQPVVVRLDDVRGGGPVDRDGELAPGVHHGQLLLRPRQAHGDALLARQEGLGGQLADDAVERRIVRHSR